MVIRQLTVAALTLLLASCGEDEPIGYGAVRTASGNAASSVHAARAGVSGSGATGATGGQTLPRAGTGNADQGRGGSAATRAGGRGGSGGENLGANAGSPSAAGIGGVLVEGGAGGMSIEGGAGGQCIAGGAGGPSEVNGPLTVSIGGPDEVTAREGDLIQLEAIAAGGHAPYTYTWSFGSLAGIVAAASVELVLLQAGAFTVALTATDSAGSSSTDTLTLMVEDLFGNLVPYFGNLHAHSVVSDGSGTPEQGFDWARNTAGYDFYAITDHAYSITDSEWQELGEAADAANEDGAFVAIRGFEWTSSVGHVNVYRTTAYTSTALDASPTLSDFYFWLAGTDGLAQFNHPGRESNLFNDLAYVAEVAGHFFAIETGNKSTGNNDSWFLAYYPQALDNGWRLAPTNNQDNHSLSTNSHRTVLLGTALTRDSLYAAMRARRLYSTDDPNLELAFRSGDAWMGSSVPAGDGNVRFVTKVVDDEEILHLALIGNGGHIVVEATPASGTTEIVWGSNANVDGLDYVYAQVTCADTLDSDGTVQIAVSAPIWLE